MASVLLPTRCPLCGRAGPAPCAGCGSRLLAAAPGPAPPGLVVAVAVLAYAGAARGLVAGIKVRNRRDVVASLGRAMAAAVAGPLHGLGWSRATVTWAPTSRSRRRRRGFDHAELLARQVAAGLGWPCVPLLDRGAGVAQTGRSRAERLRGPSFVARRPVQGPVLVVDDVITTGATLAAAGGALRVAGASAVAGVAAARTPALKPRAPATETVLDDRLLLAGSRYRPGGTGRPSVRPGWPGGAAGA